MKSNGSMKGRLAFSSLTVLFIALLVVAVAAGSYYFIISPRSVSLAKGRMTATETNYALTAVTITDTPYMVTCPLNTPYNNDSILRTQTTSTSSSSSSSTSTDAAVTRTIMNYANLFGNFSSMSVTLSAGN